MKLFKNRCYNGGNRHNFKPRYDEQPNLKFNGGHFQGCEDIRSFMVINIYVKDLCVWCGKEILKNDIKEEKKDADLL